jgi:uncharacterized protein (TIGR02569 family)
MAHRDPRPSPEVLAAWSVREQRSLAGGQGTAIATGDLVLKPVEDEREAAWLADVLDALPHRDDLRVLRPVRAGDGRWVVDGWSAFEHLDGAERAGDWRSALDVSDRFHELVGAVPWSPALELDHAWAVGDAFAWDERALPVPAAVGDIAERLLAHRAPIEEPFQLVHGDLCNNILFHDRLPPAVIDISPYWRPKRYADAIVVIDSIGWFGAGPEAIDGFGDDVGRQHLVRATLFRLGAEILLVDGDDGRLAAGAGAYERILAVLGL